MILLYLLDQSGDEEGIDELAKLFPLNSQLILSKENVEEILKRIKIPPLYSDGWFLKVYPYQINSEVFALLDANEDNLVMVLSKSKDYAEEMALLFDDLALDFVFFNGSKKPKEEILDLIVNGLDTTVTMATYLANRANWRMDYIKLAIFALQGKSKITRKDIDFYVPLKPACSMDDVVEYFLGINNLKTDSERYSVIKRYIKGYRFLYDITISRIELMLWIYDNMLDGNLSLDNYKQFRAKNIKTIREFGRYVIVSPYRFKRMVESFHYIPYEKIAQKYSYALKLKQENYSGAGYLMLMELGG